MLDFTRPLMYLVALGVAFGVGAFAGWNHEHNNFLAYKAKVQAAAEAQKRVNDTIVAMQVKKTKEIANEYQTRLGAIRAYYSGLRKPASVCNLPTVPGAASSVDGRPTDDLPGQCAETTLQLIELQRWVRDVSN